MDLGPARALSYHSSSYVTRIWKSQEGKAKNSEGFELDLIAAGAFSRVQRLIRLSNQS